MRECGNGGMREWGNADRTASEGRRFPRPFRIPAYPHSLIPAHVNMLSSNARCSPRPLRLAAYIATSA